MFLTSFRTVLVLTVALISLPTAQAQTQLRVDGTELCPQFLCPDGAIFAYNLFNTSRNVGGGLVQIDHHNLLPIPVNLSVPIVGGSFLFRVDWVFVGGEIVGGSVSSTPNPDIFNVDVLMFGNDGNLYCFSGQLDHRPLRLRRPRMPTIQGSLSLCTPS